MYLACTHGQSCQIVPYELQEQTRDISESAAVSLGLDSISLQEGTWAVASVMLVRSMKAEAGSLQARLDHFCFRVVSDTFLPEAVRFIQTTWL